MLQGGTPIIPTPCDGMTIRTWLRLDRVDDNAIHLLMGQLSVPNIQPRSALIHGAAADEQRRLRPEVRQAEMYGPFYDWVGELLCQA